MLHSYNSNDIAIYIEGMNNHIFGYIDIMAIMAIELSYNCNAGIYLRTADYNIIQLNII